jgi:hypothetical protein
MRKASWLLLFMVLSVVMAWGQITPRCVDVSGTFGPITCPSKASCGSYSNPIVKGECNDEDPCTVLTPISSCCGAYQNYQGGGPCLFTEMRSPSIRLQMLELARNNEILVPTCSGAYIPARIAFRERKEKDNGGL